MKPGIHPEYRPVVFRDASNGKAFLTRSTLTSDRTIEWEDGNTYPLVNLEISSTSHPFYTGTQRLLDTAGRVERFEARYRRSGGAKPQAADEGVAEGVAEDEAAEPDDSEAAAPEAEDAES